MWEPISPLMRGRLYTPLLEPDVAISGSGASSSSVGGLSLSVGGRMGRTVVVQALCPAFSPHFSPAAAATSSGAVGTTSDFDDGAASGSFSFSFSCGCAFCTFLTCGVDGGAASGSFSFSCGCAFATGCATAIFFRYLTSSFACPINSAAPIAAARRAPICSMDRALDSEVLSSAACVASETRAAYSWVFTRS